MSGFERANDGRLACEEVSLEELAKRYGTPLYVYSRGLLCARLAELVEGLAGRDHLVCFAAKANSCGAVLETFARQGAGADIVSGGELFRALAAGIPANRIVYSGVGKTVREMEEAIDAGISMFNIESFSELEVLSRVAVRMGARARISLRVNPDVDPLTHPYVATGLRTSKFGIGIDHVLEGYRRAAALPGIDVAGVDCHIGSQLSTMGPFLEAAAKVRELISSLRGLGFDIRYLDMGGGLGITYDAERPPNPREYGRAIREVFEGTPGKIIVEPGRSLVGNAGVLLTRVLYTKKGADRRFAVVDAGMNDLPRPSLYGAYHAVEEVSPANREEELTDVVGPICESGDFIAKGRTMSAIRAGDLLAVMSAGAYCASMASTYNSRPLAAEVMVDGRSHFVARERGTYSDLTRGERSATRRPG